MPIEILMPALSPTMTEGNLVKWLKKEGDEISSGEVMAEIETDKATMEVEAVDEGVLGKILVQEGTENVAVNTLIGLILEEGEEASSLDSYNAGAPDSAAKVDTAAALPSSAPEVLKADQENTAGKSELSALNTDQGRIFATPLARRIASQNGIDIAAVSGSGPNGRVIKVDVENHTPSANSFIGNTPNLPTGPLFEDVKLNNMRKVIAQRLTESKQTVPHFYLTVDCELDQLMQYRKQLNAALDTKVSVNDFIVKACAYALMKVPEANASWHDSFLRLYKTADVCVAVAVDGGLVTPIVKSAERKSLLEISSEVKSLASRARDGALKPEEYQGGNFTLSNLGMYGIKHFDAILNPPQACILAVGKGEQRAVVKGGQLEVATVMTVTLSVDHRAVDGAVGARYLDAFKTAIENPVVMLAS